MKVVMTLLTKEEEMKIGDIATKSKLAKQIDIVSDIMSFMKEPNVIAEGDITEDLIKDFVKGKFEYYVPAKQKIRGRIEFFNRILHHSYYPKFKSIDPIEGASILLEMLNAFYKEKKQQEEQGGSPAPNNKDEAMKEFEDIIKYGRELFDLLDDEWFQKMLEQKMGGFSGYSPKDLPRKVSEMVQNMAKELAIYELSKRLEFTIRMSKKGKFNEVMFPDDGLDVDRIKKIRDITKLLPTQYALDDDVFLKKLVSKELLKKKYMQRQEKRQILYMIVDSSGSMDDEVIKGLRKIDVCKAVTIALMKKIIDNEDLFYFRWFTDRMGQLYKIATKQGALKFLPELVYGRGADGGTDIQKAIFTASDDIHKRVGAKMDLADVLLVSDGCATVVVDECNKMLGGVDMHTVMITSNKLDKKNTYQSNLIQISKNFLMTKCDDVTDVVEICNIMDK